MKNYLLHTSEGVRDYYGLELDYKEIIETNTKRLFKGHGYHFIETPTFEYIDVFTHGNKGFQKPDLYNLINRQGEVLALKNDMTSAIARVVASNNIQSNSLKKYAYITNTFRYPEKYQGKAHEFTQAGVELIGINGIKADLEIIKLITEFLEVNKVDEFVIHIGSGGFLDNFINSLGINKGNIEEVFQIIESKDFVNLRTLLGNLNVEGEMINLLMEILQTGGRLSFLKRVMEKVKDVKALASLNYLMTFYDELVIEGLEKHILIDFSIYSYLKYYTGIIFQVFAKGASNAIIDGGRYDNLLKSFGIDLPAIGFGININQLVSLLMRNNVFENISSKRILTLDNPKTRKKAQECNKILREKGYIVENGLFDNYDDCHRYALENSFSLIINYDEIKTAKFYCLERKIEQVVEIDEIKEII